MYFGMYVNLLYDFWGLSTVWPIRYKKLLGNHNCSKIRLNRKASLNCIIIYGIYFLALLFVFYFVFFFSFSLFFIVLYNYV